MATHSSVLAWRIPWREGPGEPQSLGSQRVGYNCVTNTHTHTHTHGQFAWFLIFALKSQVLKQGLVTTEFRVSTDKYLDKEIFLKLSLLNPCSHNMSFYLLMCNYRLLGMLAFSFGLCINPYVLAGFLLCSLKVSVFVVCFRPKAENQ